MNKRYIWSALMIAAIAVACDSGSDDPQPTTEPTVPGTQETPVTPTPTDSIPEDSTPTPGEAEMIVITPIDTTLSADEHNFSVYFAANCEYSVNQDVPEWVEYYEGDNTMDFVVKANSDYEERVAILTFSSENASATFTITQSGREFTQADDSLTGGIANMFDKDFVLGDIPMEIKGTLKYSLTCASRNYNQGTWTMPKSELCSTLGITEADYNARARNSIICVPMNSDWTEGENTAGGTYGAWFGRTGTIAWGSSSIAYLEGNDMLSFTYGAHPDNNSSSCVCRLQYQDKLNETACNVEVTVTIK